MKKIFESAEIKVILFGEKEVLAASSTGGDTGFVPEYSTDPDDLPIL